MVIIDSGKTFCDLPATWLTVRSYLIDPIPKVPSPVPFVNVTALHARSLPWKSEQKAETPVELFLPSNHGVATAHRKLSVKTGEGAPDVHVKPRQLSEVLPRKTREGKVNVTI